MENREEFKPTTATGRMARKRPTTTSLYEAAISRYRSVKSKSNQHHQDRTNGQPSDPKQFRFEAAHFARNCLPASTRQNHLPDVCAGPDCRSFPKLTLSMIKEHEKDQKELESGRKLSISTSREAGHLHEPEIHSYWEPHHHWPGRVSSRAPETARRNSSYEFMGVGGQPLPPAPFTTLNRRPTGLVPHLVPNEPSSRSDADNDEILKIGPGQAAAHRVDGITGATSMMSAGLKPPEFDCFLPTLEGLQAAFGVHPDQIQANNEPEADHEMENQMDNEGDDYSDEEEAEDEEDLQVLEYLIAKVAYMVHVARLDRLAPDGAY